MINYDVIDENTRGRSNTRGEFLQLVARIVQITNNELLGHLINKIIS